MASNGAIHKMVPVVGTRGSSEDRFPPNTDWGQNRAKIGNLGQNQTSKYDESTYLPGFYGHRVLKGLIVQA